MDTAALKNQALGLTRGGIWFGAGFLTGEGILHGDSAVTIAVGIIGLLGGASWTAVANSNSSIVSAAAQVPEVTGLEIADRKLAEVARQADPSTKVVVTPPPS